MVFLMVLERENGSYHFLRLPLLFGLPQVNFRRGHYTRNPYRLGAFSFFWPYSIAGMVLQGENCVPGLENLGNHALQ